MAHGALQIYVVSNCTMPPYTTRSRCYPSGGFFGEIPSRTTTDLNMNCHVISRLRDIEYMYVFAKHSGTYDRRGAAK